MKLSFVEINLINWVGVLIFRCMCSKWGIKLKFESKRTSRTLATLTSGMGVLPILMGGKGVL